MAEYYFMSSLGIHKIPKQNQAKITFTNGVSVAKTPIGVEVPLIYDDDTSIKARSTFDSIGNPEGSPLMTILSSETNGKIPSGQFALQNVQVWKSTDPLELSFNVKLYMLNSGYDDVVYPSKELMKLCLPDIKDSGLSRKLGMLIPPGPSLTEILTMSDSDSVDNMGNIFGRENSLVNISIGNFKFNNCVVSEVTPTFSKTVDEQGYPVSAELSIEAKTCMVATRDMIEKITSKGVI